MASGDDFVTTRNLPDSLWQSVVEQVVSENPAPSHGYSMARPRRAAGPPADPMVRATHALVRQRADLTDASASGGPHRRMAMSGAKGGLLDVAAQCANAAMHWAMAAATHDHDQAQKFKAELDQYGTCDLRWGKCVAAYEAHFKALGGSVPYNSNAYGIPAAKIGRKVTISIFGDWGTGGQNAIEVMQQIKGFRPDILLHLGDVYYSGTQPEMQSRFLDPIAEVFGGSQPTCLSLCGNHDVYSGGAGYYWLIKQIGQAASYFALENDDWLFVGMDTGQSDFSPLAVNTTAASLREPEAAWANKLIAAKGSKKAVLFSHHPLFSAYEAIGGKPTNDRLHGQLRDSIPKIAAWFWGHEHRLGVYQRYLDLEKGRCLGHAAIPVPDDGSGDQPKFSQVPVHRKGGQPISVKSQDGVYRNGFAIMSLDGPAATVNYYSRGVSQPIFSEEL